MTFLLLTKPKEHDYARIRNGPLFHTNQLQHLTAVSSSILNVDIQSYWIESCKHKYWFNLSWFIKQISCSSRVHLFYLLWTFIFILILNSTKYFLASTLRSVMHRDKCIIKKPLHQDILQYQWLLRRDNNSDFPGDHTINWSIESVLVYGIALRSNLLKWTYGDWTICI